MVMDVDGLSSSELPLSSSLHATNEKAANNRHKVQKYFVVFIVIFVFIVLYSDYSTYSIYYYLLE